MYPTVRGLRTAFMLLVVVFCSAALRAQSTPTEITFWHAMRGVRGEAVRSLVARFNQQNPDVHVDEKFVGSTDNRFGNDYHALYQSVLEHLARRAQPDVSQVYENWTTQLLEVNAVASVEAVAGPHGTDADDLIPVFRAANTFNGTLMTMPFNKSVYVMYYNKALVPTPPRTIDDMRRMAQAVAQKHPGVWGLTFEPGVDIFGDLLYANGGSFFDANDKAAFGQPAGVSALTTLLDMTRVDRSTLPSLDAENLFTSGQAAMYIWTSTAQVDIQSRVKFALGVATLPGGTSRAYQFAGTNLAILAPPERQQAAWRFIRFMTSTDSTVDFAIHTGYLPVRQSALKHPRYLEFLRQNPGYRAALEALPYARIEPRIGAWESVRGILDDAVFSALGGHSEPQDVLTRAAQQADDLIGKLLGK